jgi:hypothetical protein
MARREALAVTLIAQGMRKAEVAAQCKLFNGALQALVKRLGLTWAPQRRARALPDAELAARHAHALELLRAGHTSQHVQEHAQVGASAVARIRRAHGLPRCPPGAKAGAIDVSRQITRMSHAELDALEARVAAERTFARRA